MTVIDIEFPEGLPEIYNAVRIVSEGGPGVEKIEDLGDNRYKGTVKQRVRRAFEGILSGLGRKIKGIFH